MRLVNMDGRPAVLDPAGNALDIWTSAGERFGSTFTALFEHWDAVVAWAAGRTGTDPVADSRLGPPVPVPRQIFGIGLNYSDHAAEAGATPPPVPLVFTKFVTSVAGPYGTVELATDQVDWEVELAVVIGRGGHRIKAGQAWDRIAGVTGAQDFSARDVQMQPPGSPQFSLGKSYPGFLPLGPALVTPDELPDRDRIPLRTAIDGETVQDGSTADLIFGIGELVEYLSAITPLLPGDVILTGTPAGVGAGRTPPRFLRPGEVVTTEVGTVGTMRHTCVTASS